jgi:hypothetical protein
VWRIQGFAYPPARDLQTFSRAGAEAGFINLSNDRHVDLSINDEKTTKMAAQQMPI